MSPRPSTRLLLAAALLCAALTCAATLPAADALFVSDFAEGAIYRFDLPDPTPIRIVEGEGPLEDGACHPDGRIYFATSNDSILTSWEQDGSDPVNIIPAAGAVPGPEGLSFDTDGNLYFNTRDIFGSAAGAWRIANGDPANLAEQIVPSFTTFGEGSEILVAGPHAGALLVVDRVGRQVLISEPPGAPLELFIDSSPFPTGSALFGVVSNGCGEVFVAARRDTSTGTRGAVLHFDPEGEFLDVVFDRYNGLPTGGVQFLEFDSEGNLYMASSEDGSVYRLDPDGNVTLFATLFEPAGVAVCRERRVPLCGDIPVCDAGGPYAAECQAASGGTRIPLDGSGSGSPSGATVQYSWTTDCPDGVLSDPTVSTPELNIPGPGCDLLCGVFLEVEDAAGNTARCSSEVRVIDTTEPAFPGPGHQFDVSIWPPNHGYVVFDVADMVTAEDSCGDAIVRATGCHSNEPEEVHRAGSLLWQGNGDGRFFEDCVISQDGTRFAVRAERLGACGPDSTRLYTVGFAAEDSCGNVAGASGVIRVDHDRSGDDPPKPWGKHLGPNEPPPFPYFHPTTYGDGCPDARRGRRMR